MAQDTVKPMSERLKEIRAMTEPKQLETLAKIVADDPYVEPRLEAASRIAQNFLSTVGRWWGPGANPFRDSQLTSHLNVMLSWLPTEPLPFRSRFQLELERITLEALKEARCTDIWLENLRPAHLLPLWVVLRYSRTLSYTSPSGRPAIKQAAGFWEKFLKNGVLGIKPHTLLDPRNPGGRLYEIERESRPLIDEICAWIASDRERDNLLFLVRQFGLEKTREAVQHRFWKMVLDCSVMVRLEEEETFLCDPVGWVLAGVNDRISNRVFTTYFVLSSRLRKNWKAAVWRVPKWVLETEAWRGLRRRAGLE